MKRFSQRHSHNTLSELNVTPLIDLAFVLLIIFIITAPLLEQSINVNLPTASPNPTEVDPDSVRTIAVDAGGQIYLEGQAMDQDQLFEALRDFKQADPNAGVIIRVDTENRVQKMVDVLDAMTRAGITRMSIQNVPDPE
ncbi:MAG: biopolymer transporter ExbD [Verrucomicrobiota bacterium]